MHLPEERSRYAATLFPGLSYRAFDFHGHAGYAAGTRRASRIPSFSLSAPAGDRPTKIDPNGETILPSGRLITPLGKQVKVAPHPYGLALSPDGKTLVTVNSGTKPFSVSILTGLDSPQPQVAQIPPGLRFHRCRSGKRLPGRGHCAGQSHALRLRRRQREDRGLRPGDAPAARRAQPRRDISRRDLQETA